MQINDLFLIKERVLKPKFLWSGDRQHLDDILCSDMHANFCVTGSYDGEINVWNVENHNLFKCLKKGEQIPK